MYSLDGYGRMLQDRTRVESYLAALSSVVSAKSRKQQKVKILDLGAGFGFFGLKAATLDPSVEVVLLEPSSAITLCSGLARSHRINNVTPRRLESFSYEPKEKFDIILHDIHGRLPLVPGYFPTLIDARERLLDVDGALIPGKEDLYMVPVCEEDLWSERFVSPWVSDFYGLDLGKVKEYVVDSWYPLEDEDCRKAKTLAEEQIVYQFNHSSNDKVNFRFQGDFLATKGGTMHGFFVWFVSTLLPGLSISSFRKQEGDCNAYGGPIFLPIPEPTSVEVGDQILIESFVRLDGAQGDYVWQRNVSINRNEKMLASFLQDNSLIKH